MTDVRESAEVIRRSHPDLTDAEAKELLDWYVEQGARNVAAFVIARSRGRGFAEDLEALRARRRKTAVGQALNDLRQEPPCPHGDPGGTARHPESGLPLCPKCRAEAKLAGEGTAAATDLPAPETTPAGFRRLVLTPASGIPPRPVLWGWKDRLPAGHVGLIPGREGIGKSMCLIWLSSQITRGTLPGAYYGTPRAVFYCATEDSWQHTIVPRLIAAGADLDRVYRAEVESVETDMAIELTVPRDCDLLAAEIKRLEVAMVAFDPLMSAIDRSVDTYNDRDMRTVLEPLGKLADDTGCMIVGLAHFNKSGDADPLNLVTGSRAFTAVVRAVIAIARDPNADDGGCVVSQVKNNLGRLDLPNLTYVIMSATVETEEGDAKVGRLVFTGESERSVRDILADAGSSLERTERTECAEWLRQELADGPKRTKVIEKEAERMGFKHRTFERARKLAHVKAEQSPTGSGGRNEWWLSLPARQADSEAAEHDAS